MHVVVAKVNGMGLEERLVRIQSDVGEIKADVKALTALFLDLKSEMARQIGAFKIEVTKEIVGATNVAASIRGEVSQGLAGISEEALSFRAEMKKEFGLLRASIERMNLWMLGTGITSVLSAAAIVWKLR